MMRSQMLFSLFLIATVLVGCGTSPQAKFYTMSTAVTPDRVDSKTSIIVAIAPVSVPDMIDRPQIVTRASSNQVTINEFARWAGPIKTEIPRVIAGNLTQMLRGASVYTYPQSANVKADYKVVIDVQHFDATLGDTANLDVLWSVQSVKDGELKMGRVLAHEPIGSDKSYDALVSAYSRALATISHDIAVAIHTAMPCGGHCTPN